MNDMIDDVLNLNKNTLDFEFKKRRKFTRKEYNIILTNA